MSTYISIEILIARSISTHISLLILVGMILISISLPGGPWRFDDIVKYSKPAGSFILFFQRWLRDENRLRRFRHQSPLYPRDDEFEDRIIQSYLIFKDSIPNHYGR